MLGTVGDPGQAGVEPELSPDGRYVAVDRTVEGKTQMCG
jgi:hypothetical protein